MALKKITGVYTRQVICGQAKRGAEWSFLKNMNLFVTEFNNATQDKKGQKVTVTLTNYNDGTFTYDISNASVSILLKEMAGAKKELNQQQLAEVVKQVIPFTNTEDPEKVKKSLLGTCKSIGIKLI